MVQKVPAVMALSLQPLAGAVTRTQENKNLDFVSIRDFDGTDTVALQAAIASGRSVYLPPGNYALDATITLGAAEGQKLFGAGPTLTALVSSANPAIAIPSGRLAGISDMSVSCPSGAAIQLGTRGVDPGGAGSTFCQMPMLTNLRLVSSVYGILMYGCNVGFFNSIFFESCSNTGLQLSPVVAGSGDCNANNFNGMQFYGCGKAFDFGVNLDGGVNPTENNMIAGMEATSGATLFGVRGNANTFNLWIDNNGAAVPVTTNSDSNAYVLRSVNNVNLPAGSLSDVLQYAGGVFRKQNAFIYRQPIQTLVASANAQITTSQIFGAGDKALFLMNNDTGLQHNFTLNCLVDAPIGFELTLINTGNLAGYLMHPPATGGPWTLVNWTDGQLMLSFTAAYAGTARFTKLSANSILFRGV